MTLSATAVAPARARWEPTVGIAVGVYLFAWMSFALTSRYPGYLHIDTGEIAMWSHAGFRLGYLKHPPLLPWLFGALGLVAPLNEYTLAALAVANMTVSAYAVWRIAVMTIGDARAPIALMLYLLSPALTWQAVKLNHNSILISLWPLAVWAFLVCSRRPTAWHGAVLGLVAATGVLAKYSTLMLVAAGLLAALASPRRSLFFTRPAPYVAALVGTAVLLPHFAWVFSVTADTVDQVFRAAVRDQKFTTRFLGTNLLNLLPVLIAVPILRLAMGRGRTPHEARGFDGRRALWILTLGPYAIMCVLIPVLGIRASQSWTMPVFAVLPVLLAHLLPTPNTPETQRLYKLGYAGAALLVLVAPLVLVQSFRRGEPAAIEPRREIALEAGRLWSEASSRPLAIVTGDHRFATAFWGRPFGRPLMWTSFHQHALPRWLTRNSVRERGLLIVCEDGDAKCSFAAATLIERTGGVRCDVMMSRSLYGRHGPAMNASVYAIPARGEEVALPRSGRCQDVVPKG